MSAKFGCVARRRKQKYRVRNWRDYNKALVRRGSLTLWIEQRVAGRWRDSDAAAGTGRAGVL